MRKAFATLFTLLVVACSQAYVSEPLQELEKSLDNLPFSRPVQALREALPQYTKLVGENLNSSAVNGLHVDFVLAAHEQDEDSPQVRDAVARSQHQALFA